MKGGLAAGIAAIAALQKLGIRLRGDVCIESVIGEETGGAGTIATLLRGYRADAAIILEPTRMALCPIGSGALSFAAMLRPGGSAHGATARCVSAIGSFTLSCALSKVLNGDHTRTHHPLFLTGNCCTNQH
jgi:acetylornithine deacetylase